MNDTPQRHGPRTASGFQRRFLLASALLVAALTTLGVILAERYLSTRAEAEMRRTIDQHMSAAHRLRETRQAVLADICDQLAREPRIHAALEDDAIDLLYPSAQHELGRLLRENDLSKGNHPGLDIHFYRFLDRNGQVLSPGQVSSAGRIPPSAEAAIGLPGPLSSQARGFLHLPSATEEADVTIEIYAVPIISTATFEPIASLVVGFPFHLDELYVAQEEISVALWGPDWLFAPSLQATVRNHLAEALETIASARNTFEDAAFTIAGVPHQIVTRPLNPASPYPTTQEVFVASLDGLHRRQTALRHRILLLGGALFLGGLIVSHFTARRLSHPVKALAEASEREHSERLEAEAQLDRTSRELARAARFSADASHQLKTPVAVLRAGLEEVIFEGGLSAQQQSELESLIGQTDRLARVINDLLLLSRLDSGHLHLKTKPESLDHLVAALLDDFSILPESSEITVHSEIDPSLRLDADHTYVSLILQNLLENAWKYNRPGGSIRIVSEVKGEAVVCRIGNTGTNIPPAAIPHLFERFHRGASGENVAGYGLGLNLAQDLTQLHGGTLRLLRSEDDWTEFELTLPAAKVPSATT